MQKTDSKITRSSYDKSAEEYHNSLLNPETNFYHKQIEKPAMISFLKNIVRNKEVLDLGCGSGIFTKKIASWNSNVVGLDFSSKLINIAKRENPEIKFYIGNASKTPFKNSQFDIVTSSLMAHYFKNLRLLFKEVSRILKRKGIFVFSISHPLSGLLSETKIKGKKRMMIMPYFQNRKVVWEIFKESEVVDYQHTFETIINSLADSDFVIERVLEPKPPKESKRFNERAYKKTSNYPSFLIIKARKK